ncbi:MAG: hypothetical protein OMM_09766 [Candidatus Magnetoglobus multicellularis str. Araruama]|uniref:PIN domain-containing protein n=1 Tax=Candidatus Magnetoglobus multicellularis str. Araruama TaxID=890399 RepID=A0A1V1P379_9BACT|nr:MAG: hypothetical protein OMM_09766 [Candidatus Magnetoglobus multicellularis str. Araruama]
MADKNDKNIQLYLDTSIPSAFYDTSKPLRQLITQKWFENDAELYELFISTIAIDEIEEIKNIEKNKILKILSSKKMFNLLNCLKLR